MGRAFDLEKDADLQPGELAAHFGDTQRRIAADAFELDRLLEAIAGHIGLDLGHHGLDRAADRLAVAVVAKAINSVAHDQRRLGGVEDDDGLATRGAADLSDGLTGRLGELVDVGARAGAGALRGDRGDDLAVMHLGDTIDRRDDGDGRLPAAGHHVDVGRIQMRLAVDRRDHIGADRRRGQVDHPLAVRRQRLAVPLVRPRRGRVENNGDVGKAGQSNQTIEPPGGDRHAQAFGAFQAIGFGIDADEGRHLQRVGQAHDLDHQIRADIARPYDGDLGFGFGDHRQPSS
ncbi:hypothetical protein D3C86_1301150 [compost metagenome]